VVVAHRRPNGSIDYYSSITRDLTEKRQIEQELARAGMYDSLTGLPQRPMFVEALGHAMEAAIESGVQIAVLLLGVDHFKLVNDSFGHDSGDLMLRLVTQRLEDFVRHGDLLARFSGDVFCLLVNAVPSEVEALRIADEITTAMAAPYQLDGDEVFVTMSIGIAMSGGIESVATPETMLRDADAALHRAKERGRARSELFVEDYRATAVHRLRTANDLHRALTEQEFRVVYQPEVDLRSGHVTGVEALVRWHHPERGLVPPAEFIPLAEQTGLIAGIGAWVLDTALAQAAHWRQARFDGSALTVWVNLSARQLGDPGLVELVADTLMRHGVDAAQLGLEIPESALLEDAEGAVTALSSLRELGVRLAVDDFGTGYSSLQRLKLFPLDVIKIDRSFVSGLGEDAGDEAIVRSVIGLADALGFSVVAEGVETPGQRACLLELGCDLAQGFLFARPAPASEITAPATVPGGGVT
jgi:diguanylate cyclase (GGDEF)-like protein